MRDVPRAVEVRGTVSHVSLDSGHSEPSGQPAPRVVIQPGNARSITNVEDERPPSGVKGEKHIKGPVRPAGCSAEDWEKELSRRRRQGEYDRLKAAGGDQGNNTAARLTPVSPAVAAARADAAARVEQQQRERDAAERGKGNTDRPTPYWRPRGRGKGK